MYHSEVTRRWWNINTDDSETDVAKKIMYNIFICLPRQSQPPDTAVFLNEILPFVGAVVYRLHTEDYIPFNNLKPRNFEHAAQQLARTYKHVSSRNVAQQAITTIQQGRRADELRRLLWKNNEQHIVPSYVIAQEIDFAIYELQRSGWNMDYFDLLHAP